MSSTPPPSGTTSRRIPRGSPPPRAQHLPSPSATRSPPSPSPPWDPGLVVCRRRNPPRPWSRPSSSTCGREIPACRRSSSCSIRTRRSRPSRTPSGVWPGRHRSPLTDPAMAEPKIGQPVSRRLGDLLVREGLIDNEQLARALQEQKGSSDKLGGILVKLNFVTEDKLIAFLSRQYGIQSITLSQLDIDPEVLKLVPEQIARKYEVLPIKRQGNQLTLAMADPTNVFALDDVGFMTNLQVVPVVASQAAIRAAVDRCYDNKGGGIADIVLEMEGAAGDVELVEGEEQLSAKVDVFELKESADEAPVVRLINMILVDAIRRGASDIHLEPYEKVFRVRFRVDGVLHEIMTPPKRLEAALTSRVKIMASLDIAERRLPQDGRIKLRFNQLDLTMLGFDSWSLEQFTKAIHNPYGMILITGPTGSGKTTTLYSAIYTINSPDINIMTAEDP